MKGEEIAFYIAAAAQRAVLYEVSTTPKPGLVDRLDQGAHNDMDFFTFMTSSAAIYKGFYSCALAGFAFDDGNVNMLLRALRLHGIDAEREMLSSTEGVNTHKGIIFSLGMLSAAAARLIRRKALDISPAGLDAKLPLLCMEEICEELRTLTKGLTLKDFEAIEGKEQLTTGERLFKEHGIRGIRGEVEAGFPTVERNAFVLYRSWSVEKDLSLNELFLQVLLSIMANNVDTNVISRRGFEGLRYVRAKAEDFIKLGGVRNPDYIHQLTELNQDFIKKNISPGGTADLLAVSIFLAIMEGIIR